MGGRQWYMLAESRLRAPLGSLLCVGSRHRGPHRRQPRRTPGESIGAPGVPSTQRATCMGQTPSSLSSEERKTMVDQTEPQEVDVVSVEDSDVISSDDTESVNATAHEARLEYDQQKGIYEDFARSVAEVLNNCLKENHIKPQSITHRAKDPDDFERKAARP